MDMLDFLMSNDVMITSTICDRNMTADEAFEIGGEFVVYTKYSQNDLYRGIDFEEAMKWLNGKE